MPFPRIKGRNPLPMVANNNAITEAVKSLNNLINHVDITGGNNITVTTQGQYIGVHSDAATITEVLNHLNSNYPGWADTGVNTLNTLDGDLEIVAAGTLSVTTSGSNAIVVSGQGSEFDCSMLDSCNVVFTTGTQIISGEKIFVNTLTAESGILVGTGTNQDTDGVKITPDQITILGNPVLTGLDQASGVNLGSGIEIYAGNQGDGILGFKTITGTGGLEIIEENNLLIFSGGAGGGSTFSCGDLADCNVVYTTGDQTISGEKTMADDFTVGEGDYVLQVENDTVTVSGILDVTGKIFLNGCEVQCTGGAGGGGGIGSATGVNTGEGTAVYANNLNDNTLIFKRLSGDGSAITISEEGDSVLISGKLFQTGITQIIRPYGYWQKTGDDLYYESGNVAVGGLPNSGISVIDPATAFSVSYQGVLLQRDTDLRIKDTGQLFIETCGDQDPDGTPKPAIAIGPEITGYTGAGGVYYEGVYQKESGLAIYCDGIDLNGDEALFDNDKLAEILAGTLSGNNSLCVTTGDEPGTLTLEICDGFYADLTGLVDSGKNGLLGGGGGGGFNNAAGVSSLEGLTGILTLTSSKLVNVSEPNIPASWQSDPYTIIANTGQGINGDLTKADIKISTIGNLAFYNGGAFNTPWTPSNQASLFLSRNTGIQWIPSRSTQVKNAGGRLAVCIGDVKGGTNYGGGSGIFINKDCDQLGYVTTYQDLSNLRFKTLTAGDNIQFGPEGGDHNNIRIDSLTGGPVQVFYGGVQLHEDIMKLKFEGEEASAALTNPREVTVYLTGRNGGKHYYKNEGAGIKFADTINFLGAGVDCTAGGGSAVNVTVPLPTARFSAWNLDAARVGGSNLYPIRNIGTGYTGIALKGEYANNKREMGWGADLYTDGSNSDKLVLDIDQPRLAIFNGTTYADGRGAHHTQNQSDDVSGISKGPGEGINWGRGPETANPVGYYTGLNFVGRGVRVWDTASYYCRTAGSCVDATTNQRRANTVTVEITGNVWGATNMGGYSGVFGTEGAYQQSSKSNDDGLLYFRSLKPGPGVTLTLHNEGSVEEYYEIEVPTGNTLDTYEDGVLKQSQVDGLNFTTGLNILSDTIGSADVTKVGIDQVYLDNRITSVTAGGSGVQVYNEGALLGRFSELDFVGAGVTATVDGTKARLDIQTGAGGGGGGGAGVTMLNGLTGNLDIAFSGYNGMSPYGGTYDFMPDITTDASSAPKKINIQAVPTGDFLTEPIFNQLFDFYPRNNPSGFVRFSNFQGGGGIDVSYAPATSSIYGDVTYTVTVSGTAPSDGNEYVMKNGSWTAVTVGGLANMPPRVVYETGTSHIESLKIFEVEDGGNSIRPVVTGIVGRRGETSAPLMYSGENVHTVTGHSAALSSISIDWNKAETHVKKITANTAISFDNHLIGEPHNGRTIQVILKNDGTIGGATYSYAVSWPAEIKWAGGVAPGFGHIGDGRYSIYNFTAITADADFGISDVTGIFGAVVEDVY